MSSMWLGEKWKRFFFDFSLFLNFAQIFYIISGINWHPIRWQKLDKKVNAQDINKMKFNYCFCIHSFVPQSNNLAWAHNPIKRHYLNSNQLQKNMWPQWMLNLSLGRITSHWSVDTLFWQLTITYGYSKSRMYTGNGTCESHGGLKVSIPDSRESGPGLRRGRGHCVVFLHKTLYSEMALSTQVYKWVPAHLTLGVTLRWTSTPPKGSRNTPSHFMLQKLR